MSNRYELRSSGIGHSPPGAALTQMSTASMCWAIRLPVTQFQYRFDSVIECLGADRSESLIRLQFRVAGRCSSRVREAIHHRVDHGETGTIEPVDPGRQTRGAQRHPSPHPDEDRWRLDRTTDSGSPGRAGRHGGRRQGFGRGSADGVQADRFRKLDQKGKAHLITPACGDAPEWHDHWTLSASGGLAEQMVELCLVENLSYETVRLNLENVLKPWRNQSASGECIPKIGGEFVPAPVSSTGQSMEDVLDRYADPYGADRPWCALTRLSPLSEADWPTSGLGVSPRSHPQHLPILRTVGWLTPRGHQPSAHHTGFCPPDAVDRGCGLSRSPRDPRGPGQSQHSPHGLHSRDLSTAATRHIVKRLEFHQLSQTRQLAQSCPEVAQGMAKIEFSVLTGTAGGDPAETTWNWLEQSTPMRFGATPAGPP